MTDLADDSDSLKAAKRVARGRMSEAAIPTTKYDDSGKLTLMASGHGYVMCRRPGCIPTARTIREWLTLSDKPWGQP